MALFKEVGKVLGGVAVPGSMMGKAFRGGNAAESAMPYLEQVPGMARDAYQPYIDRGNEAYGQMMPQYQTMTEDPTGYFNDLMSSYEPTKGYQFKSDSMSRALANEAAAGGYRGGEYHDRQKAELIKGLLGEDMNNYLNYVLGIQNTGLGGLGQIAQQGYGATGNLTDALGSTLGAQAGLAYQGQQQKNQQKSELMRALLQLAGMATGV